MERSVAFWCVSLRLRSVVVVAGALEISGAVSVWVDRGRRRRDACPGSVQDMQRAPPLGPRPLVQSIPGSRNLFDPAELLPHRRGCGRAQM